MYYLTAHPKLYILIHPAVLGGLNQSSGLFVFFFYNGFSLHTLDFSLLAVSVSVF